jgi:transposase
MMVEGAEERQLKGPIDCFGALQLPRRWVVERTWSWLMNHRRLQVDYERDPLVAEGFIWAAHARLLLRRLTDPLSIQRAA